MLYQRVFWTQGETVLDFYLFSCMLFKRLEGYDFYNLNIFELMFISCFFVLVSVLFIRKFFFRLLLPLKLFFIPFSIFCEFFWFLHQSFHHYLRNYPASDSSMQRENDVGKESEGQIIRKTGKRLDKRRREQKKWKKGNEERNGENKTSKTTEFPLFFIH